MPYQTMYHAALARPAESGKGWKYADDDSMLASVAKGFVEAGSVGLNPAMVYAGARVKGIGYLELGRMAPMELNELMFVGIDANECPSRNVPKDIAERLEYLRGELRGECISYGELAELEDLAPYIDPADVELAEPAGLPERQPGDNDDS